MKKARVSTLEMIERLIPAEQLDEAGLGLYRAVSASEDESSARRAAGHLLERLCEQGYLRRLSSVQTAGGTRTTYRNLLTLDKISITVESADEPALSADRMSHEARAAVQEAPQPTEVMTRPFLRAVTASSRRTDLAGALGYLYELLEQTVHHDRVAVTISKNLSDSQTANLSEFEDICGPADDEGPAPAAAIARVEESGETLHIPDLKRDSRYARLLRGSSVGGSLIVSPLKAEAYVYGTMSVWSARSHAFDPNAVSIVDFVAEFAAGLIKRRLEGEELIFIDQTTQIHNRRYFDEQLLREIERSRRTDNAMALLIADLDDFKKVNDTLGHAAGDSVLRQVGRILSENARQVDIVARYGGEEFGVILPDVSSEGALAVAERIRGTVSMHSFITGSDEQPTWDLTVSIGGALYPDDAKSQTDLIDKADRIALYEAKRRGKNRVVFWRDIRDR